MTIKHFTQNDIENLKRRLPPGLYEKITDIYKSSGDKSTESWYNSCIKAGVTPQEIKALQLYKSIEGAYMQSALKKRNAQLSTRLNKPYFSVREKYDAHHLREVPKLDKLLEREKLPKELHDMPLYRGTRISYGTALIKSGKKPGDIIRDPRYQSFSLNPGTAMYHTSKSQFGDEDTFLGHNPNAMPFKRKKKVLLEHFAKEGETGLYGGRNDLELEILYPRNKKWKISNIRDEDVTFAIRTGDDPLEGKQNVRVYTIERKKKRVVKRKLTKPKLKRKPAKKCKCKK